MKFAYTILYVENVPKSIAFYEEAFGFKRKFITPEDDYGELDTGETTISFASFELAASNFSQTFQKVSKNEEPIGIELAFTTDSITTDFARAVSAGAVTMEPIIEKPWGQKVGYLRDINGFIIEICTPMNGG